MKKFRAAALLTALALLPACYTAQKKSLLNEEFRTDAFTLPYSLGRVTVTDKRAGVETRPLKIHSESPNRADAVRPTFTPQHKAAIEGELLRFFSPGQSEVAVNIDVVEGRQLFEGSSTHAKETAETELKFTLVDENGKTLITAWGKARPEIESSSGSQEFSDALFMRALQISTYTALRRLHADL